MYFISLGLLALLVRLDFTDFSRLLLIGSTVSADITLSLQSTLVIIFV